MPFTPRISCLLPTRNRAALLPGAIESVLAQTYTNLELVIINDASTDQTDEIIAWYRAKDPRVSEVRNQTPHGCHGAKNSARSRVTGRYIAVIDDDDRWLPEKLARQLPHVDRYSIVSCLATIRSASGDKPQKPGWNRPRAFSFPDIFADGRYFFPSAMVMRKELLDAVDWFEPDLPGMDVFYKITSQFGDALVLPEPLVVFNREHSYPLWSRTNFPDKVMALYTKWENHVDRKTAKKRYAKICEKGSRIAPSLVSRCTYLLKAAVSGRSGFRLLAGFILNEFRRVK